MHIRSTLALGTSLLLANAAWALDLRDDECLITIGTFAVEENVKGFVSEKMHPALVKMVQAYETSSGAVALTISETEQSKQADVISKLVAGGVVPKDTYCADGGDFTKTYQRGNFLGGAPVLVKSPDGELNMRQMPTTESRIQQKLKTGNLLSVRMKRDDWIFVTTQSGVHGWVHSRYVKDHSTPLMKYKTVSSQAGVLNLRSKASSSSDIKGELQNDDMVLVLRKDGSWSFVEAPDGTLGWVYNKSLS